MKNAQYFQYYFINSKLIWMFLNVSNKHLRVLDFWFLSTKKKLNQNILMTSAGNKKKWQI